MKCGTRQTDSKPKMQIGLHMSVDVTISVWFYTSTKTINMWPTEMSPGCRTLRHPLFGTNDYIFQPSSGSYSYAFQELGQCYK